MLMDLVDSVPKIKPHEFEAMLNNNMQVSVVIRIVLESFPCLVFTSKYFVVLSCAWTVDIAVFIYCSINQLVDYHKFCFLIG